MQLTSNIVSSDKELVRATNIIDQYARQKMQAALVWVMSTSSEYPQLVAFSFTCMNNAKNQTGLVLVCAQQLDLQLAHFCITTVFSIIFISRSNEKQTYKIPWYVVS